MTGRTGVRESPWERTELIETVLGTPVDPQATLLGVAEQVGGDHLGGFHDAHG